MRAGSLGGQTVAGNGLLLIGVCRAAVRYISADGDVPLEKHFGRMSLVMAAPIFVPKTSENMIITVNKSIGSTLHLESRQALARRRAPETALSPSGRS